ncbi:MAG: hypothetical protein COT14_01465 [Candidatus Diapherotrites archaeon CG08_land_8_20_14_0_20_30_16]|nr:MAG: hypothetical protein COT14_01465 [Candidatus Diapherotrites archaeon CG08_land_8_20_14_0_20_30_16]
MLHKALTIFVILVFVGIILSIGFLVDNDQEIPKTDDNSSDVVIDDLNLNPDALTSVVKGNNNFVFNFYKELSKTENQFFSPYSIFSAFAILAEASKGNTQKELDTVFGYPSLEIRRPAFANIYKTINGANKDYKLSTANALWVNNNFTLLPEYINNAEKYYGAKLENIDFSNVDNAVKVINTWVENQTNNKIKDIISKDFISDATRIVIANAIYFKGKWLIAFEEKNTKEKEFTNDFGQKLNANMMSLYDERFNYFEDSQLQAIELPYKGYDLSAIVVLPKKDLESLNGFDNTKFNNILNSLSNEKVNLFLPKFKLEITYNKIKEQLGDLGLKEVFTDSADLSGFTGIRNLFVSNVVHKAFVEVNEEGTEAAAATVIGVGITSKPIDEEPIKVFNANHPFMFFIINNETKEILFMGSIVDLKE